MEKKQPIHHEIMEAVETIRRFVAEVSGMEATDQEIADALKRYFVLKEICEHIEMVRENPDLQST